MIRGIISNRPATPEEIDQLGLRVISPEESERFYKPHATVIGQLVLSWSHLHEALGLLFWGIIGGDNGGPALSVWHSSRNDRAQREMLRGAAEASFASTFLSNPRTRDDVRVLTDLRWILKECDKLSVSRDDAIHSPFTLQLKDGNIAILRPDHMYGNSRATKLYGVDGDVSVHFVVIRERIDQVATFTHHVYRSLRWPEDFPWPDRPNSRKGHENKKSKQ